MIVSEANQAMDLVMVDRALAQTAQLGLTYAVVDEPVLIEWASFIGSEGTVFRWWEHCWHGRTTDESIDIQKVRREDGCFRICLRELGHEGECG